MDKLTLIAPFPCESSNLTSFQTAVVHWDAASVFMTIIMPLDLINTPWIPARRAGGSFAVIRPADLTADVDNDPIVAPAWGRPDFDAATREFLLGLLVVAAGERARGSGWRAWYRDPPRPEHLEEAFAPLQPAFILDGPGVRFGQVTDDRMDAEDPVPVSDLWMDSQAAFFNKGRDGLVLCRASAAISLYTLQTYAPEGGRGHFTSLRGGGPLTTLAIPSGTEGGSEGSLWRTLWLNLPPGTFPPLDAGRLSLIFPWLAPPAEGASRFDPDRADTRQAFWGMPRRVALDFEQNRDGLPCSLTGRVDETIVRTFRRRPNGIQYEGRLIHPLSPVRRSKTTEAFRAVRTPPGGVGYRHWVGLVVPGGDDKGVDLARPAAASFEAFRRARDHGLTVRLRASGYETKQNKALGFTESELPVHLIGGGADEALQEDYALAVRHLVKGAEAAGQILRGAVRDALFVKRTPDHDGFRNAPSDGGILDIARARLWDRTENLFLQAIAHLARSMDADPAHAHEIGVKAAQDWRGKLADIAVSIFGELVPLDDLYQLDPKAAHARVEARRSVQRAMSGYGKAGVALFASLGLRPPEAAPKAGSKRKKEPAT